MWRPLSSYRIKFGIWHTNNSDTLTTFLCPTIWTILGAIFHRLRPRTPTRRQQDHGAAPAAASRHLTGANYIESPAAVVVSASGMAFSPHPVSAPSLFFTSAIIHTPRIMRLGLANRILIYDPIHIRWGILRSLTIGCSDSLAGLKLYRESLLHRPSPIPAQGRLQGWGSVKAPHPILAPCLAAHVAPHLQRSDTFRRSLLVVFIG